MDFQTSLSKVLQFEGGYVNDPNDPGGETNLGISKRAYPSLDISSLTPELVAPIYERDYWLAAKCDVLPSPLNFLVFDTAVNQGVSVATGLATQKTVSQFVTNRIARYQKSSHWAEYGRGWLTRIAEGLAFCLDQSGGT